MIPVIVIALSVGVASAGEVHRTEIEHRGSRVDVVYRSDVTVAHKQIGAAGAPGRAATLRCVWTAKVSVVREARSSAGHLLARTYDGDPPVAGSRPGWCGGQRSAIAADVAARSERIRAHLIAVAEADRAAVLAELEAAHDPARG